MIHNLIKSNDEEVRCTCPRCRVQAIYLNTDTLKMESVSNVVEQRQSYIINAECRNK